MIMFWRSEIEFEIPLSKIQKKLVLSDRVSEAWVGAQNIHEALPKTAYRPGGLVSMALWRIYTLFPQFCQKQSRLLVRIPTD